VDGGSSPTWDDGVGRLFSAPYWIDAGRRATVAAGWLGCMKDYGIDLSDYASVRESGATIYEHFASGAMPLTHVRGPAHHR
jgi:hypothetical protein